jgi:lipopolysaccharide transport system permease protein
MAVNTLERSLAEPVDATAHLPSPPPDQKSPTPAARRKPVVVIRPSTKVSFNVRALWQHHELLYFLVWRDVKVRYKQTQLGAAWAVLQPLALMLIFTAVFSYFAAVPSDGVPYPLFTYAGLLPWTYFAQSVARGGTSLVANAHLIGKVYFPRLLVPTAATLTPLFDLVMSVAVLAGMLAWYGFAPRWEMLLAPVFVIQCVLTAIAMSLWLSALNAKYRDVGHTIPFLIQCWMYASPVVYPVSIVPDRWRWLYSLNPMVGPIEGFRWALLGTETAYLGASAVGAVMAIVLLASGLLFFRSTERTLVDVL